MNEYDLIVIGGGRASGLAFAAAKAGKKVALVEQDRLGGTCPNRGCVPSKLLIGFAETARRIREAKRHHIEATIDHIDLEKIFQETNEYSSGVDQRYESRLPKGATLYRGTASFISNYEIAVNGEKLTAPTIVIGTGTRPRTVPFPDIPAWTSDDLFPLKGPIPKSIAIVGGGFIAVELANFFDAVGIETTLLVRGNQLLPIEDYDISKVFTEEFSKNVTTKFDCSISEATHDGSTFQLDLNSGEKLNTEALLFAIGRVPNSDLLQLDNTDLDTDKRGFIKTNENLETNVPGIFVIGDAAGQYQLQHAASFDVHYLRQRLLNGKTDPIDYPAMPHAVFTDPEIAAVGLTEEQAKESGKPFLSVTEDWLASARAMSTRLTYPRTKLIFNPETHEILGCHLIGPEASTMIHEILMLMHLKNDLREIPKMIHIHPALPEAFLPVSISAKKMIRSQKHRK